MARPSRRRPATWIFLCGGLVLLLLGRWLLQHFLAPSADVTSPAVSGDLLTQRPLDTGLVRGPCEIVSVVDGQTLMIAQGSTSALESAGIQQKVTRPVRLIATRLPTSKEEAQLFLQELAPPGPAVLELDKRRLDRDGTFLAHVYVGDRLLSEVAIRQGKLRLETYPGDSAAIGKLLKQAEGEAKRQKRGMWKQAPE